MVSILSYVGRQGAAATALPVACEARFYRGLAIAMALVCFAGFAPSYYLKGHFHAAPQLSLLLHLHGAAFTAWIALLVAQTSLVATGRTRLHRKLGVAGGVLAVLMMVLGAAVAIVRARQGVLGQASGAPPLVFLAIPFATLVVFPLLIGAALYFRKRDTHKRLMMLGTTEIVTAAVARLPGIAGNPLAFFGVTDLFVLALVIHDFATRGRVHRATLLGGIVLIASQPLRLIMSGTPEWLAFARWLIGA